MHWATDWPAAAALPHPPNLIEISSAGEVRDKEVAATINPEAVE
jgi:hypothetical protein